MLRKPHTYDHLAGFALEHPWALTDRMREVVASVIARRLAGMEDDEAGVLRAKELRATRNVEPRGGGLVAVIPIAGVIAPRLNMLSEISGGATFDGLTAQLLDAVNDPDVSTIVFDVDSPGGNVAGASEFAREVLRARTIKPIIAQANHLMASAAYWPMAAATEIVASPSSMVGSIGVYGLHDDLTEARAKLGIKREVISAGKYKSEGVGSGALTDDARAHMQRLIDGAYNRMIGDIAKGRGVSAADVRAGFGEGRVLDVDDALRAGLIDRVATLNDTLARVAQPATAGRARVAAQVPPAVTVAATAATQEQRAVSPPPDAFFDDALKRVQAIELWRLQQ